MSWRDGGATTRDVIERGPGDVVREAVPESEALYVSIDLDVLDSSVAPGTRCRSPVGSAIGSCGRSFFDRPR